MNVLYVTYGMPFPPHGGAHTRDFFLLRALAQNHRVTCLCVYETPEEAELISWCQQSGIAARGYFASRGGFARQAQGLAQHLAARRPLATFPLWDAALFAELRALLDTGAFDVLQIEHSFLIPYLDALPRAFRGQSILDLHNLGARQYARLARLPMRRAERARAWLKARAMRNWEARHAARFDRVLCVSEEDAAWLRAQNSARCVMVLENGVDTDSIRCLAENEKANTLLFVGALGYTPNIDALQWFCANIMPQLQNTFPELSLQIVGHAPNAKIRALAELPGVVLTADAPELNAFYENARLVIVPLRAGGGTRLKILEAMAYGRVVVSTAIGCEGLAVRDGEHLCIANTAIEFAERIAQLWHNHAEHARIARNARQLVETKYAWSKIGARLLGVYDGIGG